MTLQSGDSVSFVNEVGSGVIVRKLSDNRWLVEDEDGFERIFETQELVKIQDDLSMSYEKSMTDYFSTKDKKKKKAKAIKHDRDTIEIDLHIEALVDDHRGWSNADILLHQLDAFEKTLNKAIQIGAQKLIVIHGRGDGVLRFEIRKKLRDYPGILVHDASYRHYGQGATEVLLRK